MSFSPILGIATSAAHQYSGSIKQVARQAPTMSLEPGSHKDNPTRRDSYMSSSPLEIVDQGFMTITTIQYYNTASIALFYYEYLITFHREVRFVWKNRFTSMSFLFLSLSNNARPQFDSNLPANLNKVIFTQACTAFAYVPGAMDTINIGIITIFLVWRTYAIYFHRSWVLAVTVPLGIINVVIVAVEGSYKMKTIYFTLGTGALHSCTLISLLSKALYWTITILFDTLISVLTMCKSYRMHRENRRVGIESRLVAMLLQDASYYSILTAVNVLNFFFSWAEAYGLIHVGAGNSSLATPSISVIVVSRMMLNIMEAADPRAGDNYEDSSNRTVNGPGFSTLQFATQYSIVTTTSSPLGPSIPTIQRHLESVHKGLSPSIVKGMVTVETVPVVFVAKK